MPKVIKKKPAKAQRREGEEIEEVITKARSFSLWRKETRVAAIALPVILLAAVAVYYYVRSTARGVADLEYEGYKAYYGIYEAQPKAGSARFEDALEKFKKAKARKATPFSLYYIANSFYSLGRYDDSANALIELIAKFPADERFAPLAYVKLSAVNEKRGKPEEALKNLEAVSGRKAAGLKDVALMESARILAELGRTDEARKKYETLVKELSWSPFAKEAEARLKAEG